MGIKNYRDCPRMGTDGFSRTWRQLGKHEKKKELTTTQPSFASARSPLCTSGYLETIQEEEKKKKVK